MTGAGGEARDLETGPGSNMGGVISATDVEPPGELVGGGRFSPDTLPGRIQAYLETNGQSQNAAYQQAGTFKKYEQWLTKYHLALESAPQDALTRCTRETWKPQGQNRSAALVQHTLQVVLPALGITASLQKYERYEKPRTAAPPPQSHSSVAPVAAIAPNGSNGATPPAAVVSFDAPETHAPAGQVEPFPLSQVPKPAAPKPAAPARAAAPGPVLPTGGKVRIVKVATGVEGPGISPGQRLEIGSYFMEDLSGEGPVRNFIDRWIRPRFGPAPGQPDTTYIVQRLDEKGNQVAEFPFYFAAPLPEGGGMPGAPWSPHAPGQNFQPFQPFQPAPSWPQPTQAGNPGGFAPGSQEDRFVSYLMEQERRGHERYEKLEEQLRRGGTDPGLLAVLLDKAKPEPIPWERLLRELRGGGIPGGFGDMGMSGLTAAVPTAPVATVAPAVDPFASAAAANQPLADGMVKIAGQVLDLARARQEAPAPVVAPAPPQKVITEDPAFIMLLKAATEKPERNHEVEELKREVQALREQLSKPPEKSRGLGEYLADMKAMRETMDFMGGGAPNSWVEGIGILAENADKISDLVANIMKLGKAPQLPGSGKPAGKPGEKPPAGRGAQGEKIPPLPENAAKALIGLRDAPADNSQLIVDNVFGLVQALGGGPPPWNQLARMIADGILQCDSKPEIRALVTNVFTRTGAKRMITDQLVEKISNVIHVNYTFLYAQLTGGKQKVLADGAPPGPAANDQPEAPAQPIVTPAPAKPEPKAAAPEAEAEGEEGGEEEGEEEEAEGEIVEEGPKS